MPQNLLKDAGKQIMKSASPVLLTTLLMMLSILPAWGDDKEKDEETLKNAATVLQGMLSEGNVPPSLLEKADCVVVLPGVKKFGLGVGGTGGRGPMSCRTGKDFSGKWSAPAMYSISGVSAGLQVGGSSTDYVLLIMDPKGAEALLKGETKLGHDVSAAAGPAGATAAGAVGDKDILTYGRSGGLFAGTSLGSASLYPDNDANKRLYGKEITAQQIVRGNAVQTPEGGQPLVSLLNSKAPKHGA